jgi:hypothetical protein
MMGFSAVRDGLMHDNMGPQAWSWFLGIVIPIPALVMAWWGINPGSTLRTPKAAVLVTLVLVGLHAWCFRSNLLEMRKRYTPPGAEAPSKPADNR